MEKLTDWTQIGVKSLTTLGQTIMSALPNIIGAFFLLIIGWIIAKIMSFVVRKGLVVLGFDKLAKKINADELLDRANINTAASTIVSKFVYWVLILLFFVTASDTLGWVVVSSSISDLIAYLPRLFSAIVLFVIGFYIASFVRKGIKGVLQSLSVASSQVISNIAFYIIVVIITLTALDQAGVDTAILTSNVTIVIGGIVIAFAVSFGIGSRDILSNILSSFYSRKNFVVGDVITIGDVTGTITTIDNTSCIIKTSKGKTVIPVKRLLAESVEIKDQ